MSGELWLKISTKPQCYYSMWRHVTAKCNQTESKPTCEQASNNALLSSACKPIMKGTGASRKCSIDAGNIGTYTCCHVNGNISDIIPSATSISRSNSTINNSEWTQLLHCLHQRCNICSTINREILLQTVIQKG